MLHNVVFATTPHLEQQQNVRTQQGGGPGRPPKRQATSHHNWEGGQTINAQVVSHKFAGEKMGHSSKGQQSFDHNKLHYTIETTSISARHKAKKNKKNSQQVKTVKTMKALKAFAEHKEAVRTYNTTTEVGSNMRST